jgi:Protein of unknown function (DUF3244).
MQAQEFAPKGAEWTYNTYRGIFRATVDRDTVINGTLSRVVAHTPHVDTFWARLGFPLYDIADLYVYNNADTVFVYNSLFNKFTPLYVFNVSEGDTVCLPVLPSFTGSFNGTLHDSTFCVIIDSVRNIQYQTTLLKTIYTHAWDTGGIQHLKYDVYSEKLGNLSSGLMPRCIRCIYPLSESVAEPWDIRCYSDNNFAVKLVQEDCYKGIRVSVRASPSSQNISLYPNPATDEVHISFGTVMNGAAVQLLDMRGAIISSQTISSQSSTSFSLQGLANGMYLIRVTDGRSDAIYRNFIIAK